MGEAVLGREMNGAVAREAGGRRGVSGGGSAGVVHGRRIGEAVLGRQEIERQAGTVLGQEMGEAVLGRQVDGAGSRETDGWAVLGRSQRRAANSVKSCGPSPPMAAARRLSQATRGRYRPRTPNYRSPNEDRAAPTLRNPIRKPHRKNSSPTEDTPRHRLRFGRAFAAGGCGPPTLREPGRSKAGRNRVKGTAGRPGPMRNATDRQLRTRTGSYEHGPAATNTDRPASFEAGRSYGKRRGVYFFSRPIFSIRAFVSGLWPRKAT